MQILNQKFKKNEQKWWVSLANLLFRVCCFLLAFLVFAPSQSHATVYRSKVTIDLLNELCSRTNNKSFCLAVLKLNPESTLRSLALKTLDLAHNKATTTLSLISSLIKKTTDPDLREVLKTLTGPLVKLKMVRKL